MRGERARLVGLVLQNRSSERSAEVINGGSVARDELLFEPEPVVRGSTG